jgi:hypothetical protein
MRLSEIQSLAQVLEKTLSFEHPIVLTTWVRYTDRVFLSHRIYPSFKQDQYVYSVRQLGQ